MIDAAREQEAAALLDFFNTFGISHGGRGALTRIFWRARKQNVSVGDILKTFGKEWQQTWRYQDAFERADPHAFDIRGFQNKATLETICCSLDIPSLSKRTVLAPPGSFVVRTGIFIYLFMAVNDRGIRKVDRQEKPVDFTWCRVTEITMGERMVLEPVSNIFREKHITEYIVHSFKRL